MALAIQYDLFEPNDELSLTKKEIALIKEQQNNLRKGLFVRHNELMKLYLKQQEEIDELKAKLTHKAEILTLKVLEPETSHGNGRKGNLNRKSLRENASVIID